MDYQFTNLPGELLAELPDSYRLAMRHNFLWEAKTLPVLDFTTFDNQVLNFLNFQEMKPVLTLVILVPFK